jgi:hypothetical protein
MADKQQRQKPQNWHLFPDDFAYCYKLLLPSFGVSVTPSDPTTISIPSGTGTQDTFFDSGDAYSVSYLRESSRVFTTDQEYGHLDLGYLRRILLYILDKEEYLQTLGGDHGVFLGLPNEPKPSSPGSDTARSSDSEAQVRLTDLRLAKDIRPADLSRELRSALRDLPLPLTTQGVVRWKWKVLSRPKGLKNRTDLDSNDQWYTEETVRITIVSFTAAALLLLLDLNMRRIEKTSRDTLVQHVITLARIVRDLITNLDRSANELMKLLAGRKGSSGGRPPNPKVRSYVALSLYRMGWRPTMIAHRVGIRAPGRQASGQGAPKNWMSNLRELVMRGVEVEKERFPSAAEVFARKDEEQVRATAIEVYDRYLESRNWEEAGLYADSVAIGDDLLTGGGVPVSQGDQEYRAYVQLGSSLKHGIDPVPITGVKFRS